MKKIYVNKITHKDSNKLGRRKYMLNLSKLFIDNKVKYRREKCHI